MLLPMPLGNVAIAYSIHMANTPGRQQIQDMAIGLGCNVLNELCGSAWRPSYVQFAHARTAESRPHLTSICTNPIFDAEVTAIVFPASWMDRPLPDSEPARCFKAFLHNNYIGLVLFAGVVLDLWRA